jgi:hypothetical protein
MQPAIAGRPTTSVPVQRHFAFQPQNLEIGRKNATRLHRFRQAFPRTVATTVGRNFRFPIILSRRAQSHLERV